MKLREKISIMAKGIGKEEFQPFVQYEHNPVGFCLDILGIKLWSAQVKIMEAVRDNERVSVAACYASGKCMLDTDRITLADGTVLEGKALIGRAFGLPTFDPITGAQTPGLSWAADNGLKMVYRVQSAQGREINRTGNHPLWVADYVRQRDGVYPANPRWLPVDQIVPGKHLVALPSQLKVEGRIPRPIEEVRLCGYVLGDGGCTTNSISFTQAPGMQLEEVKELGKHFGCDLVKVADDPYQHYFRADDNAEVGTGGGFRRTQKVNRVAGLVREWGLLGKRATEKTFPSWVWNLPNEQLAVLLNRLFACDGYCYQPSFSAQGKMANRARVGITLASETMVRDVELACLRLGITGRMRARTIHGEQRSHKAWEWVAETPQQVLRFRDVVGIYGKDEKLQKICSEITPQVERTLRKWRGRGAPEGFYWDDVKVVEAIGERPTVAISVPGTHAYTTTFAEHNTFTAACLVLWWIYTRRPALVVTTAPTSRQVRTLLFREIRKLHRKAKARLFGRMLQMRLEIADDWLAFGFSSDAPNSVAGLHEAKNVLFIEDEAAGMLAEVVEGFEGITASENSRHLKIGNPICDSGPFFDSHLHPDERERWVRISIDAEDTPNFKQGRQVVPGLVTKDWVEDKRHRWLKRGLLKLWETKVKGRFFVTSAEKVIPEQWVIQAQERWKALHDEGKTPENHKNDRWRHTLGVDIAVGGGDETVLYELKNGFLRKVDAWQEENSMVQARDIVKWAMKLGVEILNVDVSGPGKGVGDKIRELIDEGLLEGVTFNEIFMNRGAHDRETYAGFSDELQFLCRDAFSPFDPDPVAIDPDDKDVARELCVRTYTVHPKSEKIITEGKLALKKRGVDSPDHGDGAALCFYQGGGVWWN